MGATSPPMGMGMGMATKKEAKTVPAPKTRPTNDQLYWYLGSTVDHNAFAQNACPLPRSYDFMEMKQFELMQKADEMWAGLLIKITP
eukprot:NODE_3396_length_560_cov_244.565558_g2864_i0.p1 GENE.NODE_3396_length_560_cov_244.565558_g2864_i0~~NODE_3396_length_560_cov_244.565558_g2864_i0.p1  ORF type:complete len:87 (+),score=15.05 NODE_3396_length_560_cov_244.565558_g2864_i0:116-376(+)